MIKRLGDIATYVNGYAFKPSDRGDKGLPIIRIQDLTGNSYDLGYYDGVYPSKIEVNDGDILISWSGSLGIYIWNHGKALLNQHIFKVVFDKEEVNKQYYVFAVQYKLQEMISKTHGATMKHIVKKDFNNVLIPVPTLEMQSKMASVLSKINTIISARQKQIKMLDELIKARFVELFGDPIINTKHLETKDLKDVLILKAGDFTAASDIADEPSEINPYPCYGGNGIRGYVSEYNQDGEYSLIGRQGALSGNVQFISGKFKNTEHALLVTPIVEMNNTWLNQLLLNLDLKRYQTGAAQPGLSVKNLQEIQIISVPIDEQNKFADFIKQVDKSKVAVQAALDKTQLLFDSLMQEYFG